nr:hypothetical protein [Helicobacter sp. UBA3407]
MFDFARAAASICDINRNLSFLGSIYHEEIKNKVKSESKEFDMNQSLSKEESEQKIANLLEKTPVELAYLQGTEDNPLFFVYNKVLLEQDGDSLTQIQRDSEKKQCLKDNVALIDENEFLNTLNKLTKEIKNILVDFYQKNGNSEEFKELLQGAVGVTYLIKSREENQEKLLNLLKQSPSGENEKETQEFLHKLTGSNFKTKSTIEEEFKNTKEDVGLLGRYAGINYDLEVHLETFFRLANLFGTIPQSSQARIQDSLQIAQRYLYNQSGDMDKSFKVGDYVIAFNEDPMLVSPFLDGSGFTITYHKSNDILAAIVSSFDSSQTFFEVLEQRDKLEKENQELKTKQDYNAYGISKNTSIQTDSSSNSIMQTLLKESKENKKNQGE